MHSGSWRLSCYSCDIVRRLEAEVNSPLLWQKNNVPHPMLCRSERHVAGHDEAVAVVLHPKIFDWLPVLERGNHPATSFLTPDRVPEDASKQLSRGDRYLLLLGAPFLDTASTVAKAAAPSPQRH